MVSKSTKAFWEEGRRTKGYSLFDFIHGYVYSRWPYLYIGIGTDTHPLTGVARPLISLVGKILSILPHKPPTEGEKPITFADTYHGKVMPLESARKLIMVKEEIRQPDLESVVPYALARAIILKNPDHIVALDCPCRAGREHPCQPMDVCLIVGEPFASFIHQHQPDHSRWVSREEAAAILQAEDERGHVHHAFFKDAMLGRYYAICNCCACCCGAMQAHQHGTPMLASSGYVARVDEALCAGCGTCVEMCQFKAISVPGSYAAVDEAACMGCGVCVNSCPNEALSLQLAPERGIPLEIEKLVEMQQR